MYVQHKHNTHGQTNNARTLAEMIQSNTHQERKHGAKRETRHHNNVQVFRDKTGWHVFVSAYLSHPHANMHERMHAHMTTPCQQTDTHTHIQSVRERQTNQTTQGDNDVIIHIGG